MVKLKQLATAPMAQEKRISEQEGQQEGQITYDLDGQLYPTSLMLKEGWSTKG